MVGVASVGSPAADKIAELALHVLHNNTLSSLAVHIEPVKSSRYLDHQVILSLSLSLSLSLILIFVF